MRKCLAHSWTWPRAGRVGYATALVAAIAIAPPAFSEELVPPDQLTLSEYCAAMAAETAPPAPEPLAPENEPPEAEAAPEALTETANDTAEIDVRELCASFAADEINAVIESTATTGVAAKKKPNEGIPAISQPAKASLAPPVAFNAPSESSNVSMRTSLSTWRDYNTQKLNSRIERAKESAGGELTLPKGPAVKPKLDVWSSMQQVDSAKRAGVGADYKVNPDTTVGIAAEAGGTKAEEDQKLSAYMAFKAAPMVSVDTRTEWGTAYTTTDESTAKAEKGAISVAPRINHSFKLNDGETLEPFVTFKQKVGVGAADATQKHLDVSQGAGAGLTYAKPDSYSLSVTTDLENLGSSAEPANLNSRVQLKVPLP